MSITNVRRGAMSGRLVGGVKPFDEIEVGENFVRQGFIGLGDLTIPVDVFQKLSSSEFTCLQDGDRRSPKPGDEFVLIRIEVFKFEI